MVFNNLRNRVEWIAIAAGLILVAWISLNRVMNGRLFLVSMPFDRAPLAVEVRDATATARVWTWPALSFLLLISAAITARSPNGPIDAALQLWERFRGLIRMNSRLCSLLAAACIADFLSTAHYFRVHRIDDELHPGIKLITYAYGLTIGSLAGKTVQALLALTICAVFPKIARPTLIVLIIAYTAVAVWNLALG